MTMSVIVLGSLLFCLINLFFTVQYASRLKKTLNTYKEELFKEAELRNKLEGEYNVKLNELKTMEKNREMKTSEIVIFVTQALEKFEKDFFQKTGGSISTEDNKDNEFILDSLDFINNKIESIENLLLNNSYNANSQDDYYNDNSDSDSDSDIFTDDDSNEEEADDYYNDNSDSDIFTDDDSNEEGVADNSEDLNLDDTSLEDESLETDINSPIAEELPEVEDNSLNLETEELSSIDNEETVENENNLSESLDNFDLNNAAQDIDSFEKGNSVQNNDINLDNDLNIDNIDLDNQNQSSSSENIDLSDISIPDNTTDDDEVILGAPAGDDPVENFLDDKTPIESNTESTIENNNLDLSIQNDSIDINDSDEIEQEPVDPDIKESIEKLKMKIDTKKNNE